MATTTTSTLANEYQKFFSKKLLKNQVQKTVLDQFATKANLPKRGGAKIISFFRRSNSANNSSGNVAAVQTLAEGVPINTFTDATLSRVDVPLVQYGEAIKVTDIVLMTELFDALQQDIDLMSEDAALHADNITRNVLVAASQAGTTFNNASGTTTEYIGKMYAQALSNFSALNSATVSGGKLAATDILRAVTQLKINRAPTWGGDYVAVIPPQASHDMQNDPDWIDSHNYGSPSDRFRGELGKYAGARFVEHTNPFLEDGTGSEGTYAIAASQSNRIYRTFVLGQGAYGTSALDGQSPYSPKVMIVDKPDKTDILNQFIAAGWKAYWGASALNSYAAISISHKTEFVGT